MSLSFSREANVFVLIWFEAEEQRESLVGLCPQDLCPGFPPLLEERFSPKRLWLWPGPSSKHGSSWVRIINADKDCMTGSPAPNQHRWLAIHLKNSLLNSVVTVQVAEHKMFITLTSIFSCLTQDLTANYKQRASLPLSA